MPVLAVKPAPRTMRCALELGGAMAGELTSVEGGHASADVVEEKLGPDHIVHKHLANVKYEDITLTCGVGMSKGFYDYIKATFNQTFTPKDGSIKIADFDGNVVSEMDFTHGLLSEVSFPALDASSKDAAKLTVKISPEFTRMKKGSGKLQSATGKAKQWNISNFRLVIAGVDCTHVSKIESFGVKAKLTGNPVGEMRDYQKPPSGLEVSNLTVTVDEAHASDFYAWHEDFVIKGNNSPDKEKSGTLDILAPDLKEKLFELTFSNLGIFRLTPDKVEARNEQIRRVKAEMYCEKIDFTYSSGALLS
jgi:phage tail-like protein